MLSFSFSKKDLKGGSISKQSNLLARIMMSSIWTKTLLLSILGLVLDFKPTTKSLWVKSKMTNIILVSEYNPTARTPPPTAKPTVNSITIAFCYWWMSQQPMLFYPTIATMHNAINSSVTSFYPISTWTLDTWLTPPPHNKPSTSIMSNSSTTPKISSWGNSQQSDNKE